MTTIDEMIQYMIVDLPGCTPEMIKQTLRRALREFCIKTEAWRSKVTLDVVADQTDYDLRDNFDAIVQRIIAVKVKNSTNQVFDDITPVAAYQYDLEEDITLSFLSKYAPDTSLTDGLEVEIAWRPQYEAEELSGLFLDRYADGIMSYAKYYLMKMGNKTWSNPSLAMEYKREYETMRTYAMREKYTKNKPTEGHVEQIGRIL
jgi:hypothetical protein